MRSEALQYSFAPAAVAGDVSRVRISITVLAQSS